MRGERRWMYWVPYALLFAAFLYPLLSMDRGFAAGDYAAQFYPWTLHYAQALKQGYLALWTPLVQSGFPLFAEGQTGMLYLPNLLLYGTLPFEAAYNITYALHFLTSSILFHLYARRCGLTAPGAALATLAYAFGSAYAGGYYNVVTLRVLTWFPLCLYAVERYRDGRSWGWPALIGACMGQMWLAGFPQLAGYACGFTVLYGLMRLGGPGLAPLALSCALGIAIGLPQLWATLELASHSTRSLQDAGFALWGSAAPWSLAGLLVYPWGTFLGSQVCVGVVPLLAVIVCPVLRERKLWWCMVALSVFMALGVYNPLYWLLVELPVASLLRKPSKFLYFTAFFLALLAGAAYDELMARVRRGDALDYASRRCTVLAAAVFVLGAAGATLSRTAGPLLTRLGEWYVQNYVLGRSYHRGTLEDHLFKVREILRVVQRELDPTHPYFWVPAGLVLLTALLIRAARPTRAAFIGGALLALATADLYLYARAGYGPGFTGNITAFQRADRTAAYERDGKWLDLSDTDDHPLSPNRNLISGHAQAGAYAPLLDKDYYLYLGDTGALDDSLGRKRVSDASLADLDERLDRLGIRYWMASRPLVVPGSERVRVEGDRYIYRNSDGLKPEYVFESDDATVRGSVRIIEDNPLGSLVEVRADGPGRLVRHQVFDRGWVARADDRRLTVERVEGVFQGIRLPAGRYELGLSYEPDYWTKGLWVHLTGYAAALCLGGAAYARRRRHDRAH
ncbi:MAG: hypothetical protein MOGMAGMI_00829 [Candidatus Omnitrophica bacterium]|nr:hypothetical protein [Candidatus Omnitrophota bacterium]